MVKQHMVVWGPPKFWRGWVPFLDGSSLSCKVLKEDVVTLMGYYFPFLQDVLQAQKLLKLEEVEVEVEEELKGEGIVGSSGQALRPLGMGTTFI